MKTVTSHFKIRSKDGLYSTGGMSPSFTKKGKTWRKKAHLLSHLRQLHDDGRKYLTHEVKIVEFQVVEEIEESAAIPFIVYIDEDRRKKREAWERHQVRAKEEKDREERRLYEELRKKYEI